MKLTRIEVKSVSGDWGGPWWIRDRAIGVNDAYRDGVKQVGERFNVLGSCTPHRCFFTDNGWDRVGAELERICKAHLGPGAVRRICVRKQDVEILRSDEDQALVAA